MWSRIRGIDVQIISRHNIGFMAAERLIDKRDLRCNRLRFRALTEVIEFGGANVLLMMPQTYMNLSGEAVGDVRGAVAGV